MGLQRRNRSEYEVAVKRIREENNRMFIRRSRYYMLKLAIEQAIAMGRSILENKVAHVLNNTMYISDNEMSNEE